MNSIPAPMDERTTETMSPDDVRNFVDNVNFDDLEQTSASYTAPGSSGTLKETHIFTPSKFICNETPTPQTIVTNKEPIVENTSFLEFEQSSDKTGVVIKESVVKKEYRDIEYDPSKLKVEKFDGDDFTEFQSVDPSIVHNSINDSNEKPSTDTFGTVPNISNIKWPKNSSSSDINVHGLDNFTINRSTELDENSSTKHLEKVVSSNEFERITEPTINRPLSNDLKNIDDNHISSTKGISYISEISAIPAIVQANQSYSIQTTENHVSNSANSIFDIKGPITNQYANILTPKVADTNINVIEPNISNEAPIIAWPEPGINSDELARFEQMFSHSQLQMNPTTNTSLTNDNKQPLAASVNNSANCNTNSVEDDEWSDFVSVEQPQTPITNILNKNLQKHQNNDDDDWSEFVSSSTTTTITMPPQRNMQPYPIDNKLLNTFSGSNFTSWNAPSQPNIYSQNFNNYRVNSNASANSYSLSSIDGNLPQMHSNVTNKGNNSISQLSQIYQDATIAPSIISVPDLQFVAPKTLVNMPRTTFTKK